MMFKFLKEHGFYIVNNVKSLSDALRLTQVLGEILPLNGNDIQILQPKNKLSSSFKSLSYFYGFDSFPLHTDTTFWCVPARYIIFFLKEKVDTGTVLSNKNQTALIIEKYVNKAPIFLRKQIGGNVYSFPWFGINNTKIMFDPCYMQPINEAAKDFIKELQDMFVNSEIVKWDGDKLLVVDNWKILHGREKVFSNNTSRKLVRFYRGENGLH